jgi:hypothetical protein
MKKTIKYYFSNKVLNDSIVAAKTLIPEWYKNVKPANFKKDNKHKNVKNCVPFLDALSIGYMITLPIDLNVLPTEDYTSVLLDYGLKDEGYFDVYHREEHSIPFPEDVYEIEFIWRIANSFKLPKGYSALLTHPLNRNDLPFISLSGVVDLDEGMPKGNFPFYIKKGFEGKIPMGTPIIQVIPFKRDSWKLEQDDSLSELDAKYHFLTNRVNNGWYKNNMWTRKSFE